MATKLSKDEMAWYGEEDSRAAIEEVEALLGCGIFSKQGARHLLFKAAATQLLICMSDLLKKASAMERRVTLTSDMVPTGDIEDVTDLIVKCRSAACHIYSPTANMDSGARFVANVSIGKTIPLFSGGEPLNPYDDDIAIHYGDMRLYINRHVVAAFREIERIFARR
jgi:hypothetical protein